MKLRLGLVLLLGSLTTLAHAYVDNALTLGAVIKQSTHITVVRVYKVNRDKRAIIFKKVADLKGKEAAEEIKHQIPDHGFHHRTSRTILDWAEQAQESGRVAILFRNDKVTQVCLGTYWYECAAQQTPPWWSMNDGKPELSLAYFGTTEKLRTHVATMLAGKPTIITCLPHGQNGFGAYFHIAFRTAPGRKDFPLQRVRASLDMPAVVYRIGKDPKYFVGLGAADAKEVPPLIELLKHKETRVRAEAAEELGMIGPNAKDAVTALAGALEDREVQVRLSAATSLALVDPGHKALVPALIAWLKAGVPRERWSAAEILGQVGADAEAAIPALLEALKDKSLRGVAADALGGIGPKCRAAVPDLVKVLKDDDVQVRYSAAVALARIGGPGTQPAVPILMEMWTVKGDAWNASLYIGALGPEAKETVPFLLKNVTHHNAWTLWSVDPRAAIPYLNIADIGNDESSRHYWSSAYFRMVGPRTKEMAEALTEGLRDGKVPQVASWATNLLRTEAKLTVPILIRGLKSNDATIRVNSARVLGQIGPAAKEAVAALKTAVKDEDNRVRQAATQSLKQVQAK